MVPTAQRRHRTTRAVVAASSLLIAMMLAACSMSPFATSDDSPDRVPHSGASPPGDSPHLATGPLRGRTTGELTVRDAASRIVVRLVSLPDQLYRVSTPAGSGLAPRVTARDGRVRVTLVATGADGPDVVEVLLNRAVRWDLRLPAGAGEKHLDLVAGRLRRITLGSAAGLVSLRLPRPRGSVPLVVAGPVGELSVAAPAGTAIRLRLRAGAGTVSVPWSRRTTAGPRTTLVSGPAARPRYAIDVRPEAGAVTVALPRTLSAGRCVPSCSGGTRGPGR
ncbi:hypothetical protein [Actinoplanes sp. RD1]|uniref:hypothetical protein n=1 Tax=Actinoplanes sp. RD1 TaxID=3064538 RepID=UPI002742771F|nr:hypothetical protein [Actinoplanes sp. RD1]